MIITAYKYAKECHVSIEAIYHRIRSGTLKPIIKTMPDGKKKYYVDTDKNPPIKYTKPHESRK